MKVWPLDPHQDLVVFDTETTGQIATESRIVELGAVRVNSDWQITDRFLERVNPECLISKTASGVHGITNADVQHCRTAQQVVPDFVNWAGSRVISAYNLPFDQSVIRSEIERIDFEPDDECYPAWRFDIMQLAIRRLHPLGLPDQSYKLTSVAEHLNVLQAHAHSAMADSEMALGVLRVILEGWRSLDTRAPVNAGEFQNWMDRPSLLKIWPFGKHKGLPTELLPVTYLQWALSNLTGDAQFSADYVLRTKYG